MVALLAVFSFSACDVETNEEPGGTSVQNMAGQWDVKVDAVDANGNVTMADPYGLGTFTLLTFNTAANTATEMWITDSKNFWDFKFKVSVDYAARTFSASQTPYIDGGDGTAIVTDGKVLEGKAVNLHGLPNDSIVFNIKFSDDDNALTYRISGQRYTGFTE